MHHGVAIGRVHQRPRAQPVDQFTAVRRRQHIVERIVLARALEAFVLGHEVQIVIAEHHHGALSERTHEAQDLEGFRASIDEITDEPQPVFCAEAQFRDQRPQLVEATWMSPIA